MPVTTVGVREFAKKIGVSHTFVYKLIKEGVIPKHDNGQVPLELGLKKYNEYYEKNKDSVGRKTRPVDAKAVLESSTPTGVSLALNKAKLAEKTYQARLKELDYKARTGELLDREKVENEAAWLAEQIKSKLLAIPPRISSLCEGREARDIEAIISDAINDALKELQKVRYGGGTGEKG